MSTSPNQRSKLLYLMKILLEKTDVENPMSINEIITELGKYSICAERKSIYSDFEILKQFGLDIEVSGRSKATGYYVARRQFELPDLKLLIEAVQSADFISEEKGDELISKLSSLTSAEQAKALEEMLKSDSIES
jgi:hypothetical protein